MSQYVGKSISLVDTKNVRYIGVLSSISAETSTLVLENVTVYGTETRASGSETVPREAEPRARLEFKGSDVRDLQVLESEPAQPKEKKGSNKSEPDSAPKQPQLNNRTKQTKDDDDQEDFIARTQRLSLKSDKNDFGESSAAYNKSNSFFDTLGDESSSRTNWAQERSLNMETFGEAGSNRTRGSGRGRGSHRERGGFRGREGFNRRPDRDSSQRNTRNIAGKKEGRDDRSGASRQTTRGRGRGNGRGQGSNRKEAEPMTEFVPKGQIE